MSWTADQLDLIGRSDELEILTRRWTPIWAVTTGGQVYVRTWHARDTGWYGHAVRTGRARIRVPGLETDVTVAATTERRAEIDGAYRDKYARYGTGAVGPMVADAAAASTLLLSPAGAAGAR
ncbi:DUF2255 family protein [Actinoplanes sp. NPDC051470]|uniref:DUF2255 family protein n=1 Tax=Actinoplanes sp. NPDC051470 TaxID=3157224 RepID=UPI0034157A41